MTILKVSRVSSFFILYVASLFIYAQGIGRVVICFLIKAVFNSIDFLFDAAVYFRQRFKGFLAYRVAK
jgi:hypothetical protein